MSLVTCLKPKIVHNSYIDENIVVPCGKCAACLSSRAHSWARRLEVESQCWNYTIFFSLTYDDDHLPIEDVSAFEIDDPDIDNKFLDLCCESSHLIDIYGGVPHGSVRDIQLFIKRLRKRVYKYEKDKESACLRYFIALEYGPTTFRPHYHGLLFTNSTALATRCSEYIPKSWSDYNQSTGTSTPIGKVDVQHVSSTAARYCAEYVTFNAYLPGILQHKRYKPFALFSKNPTLGSLPIKDEQIQKVFHRGLTTFTYSQPDTGKYFIIPLWRSFRARLFPKCLRYGSLSHSDRVRMYSLALNPRFDENPTKALGWLYTSWYKSGLSSPQEIRDPYLSLYVHVFSMPVADGRCEIDETSFKRAYALSKHVVTMANYFCVTLDYYVSRIELYYENLEKQCLTTQLLDEKAYLEEMPVNDICRLPYMLDLQFYNNNRELDLLKRDLILGSFHLKRDQLPSIETTKPYLELSDKCEWFITNSHKTRAKNEWLDSHPKFKILHNV